MIGDFQRMPDFERLRPMQALSCLVATVLLAGAGQPGPPELGIDAAGPGTATAADVGRAVLTQDGETVELALVPAADLGLGAASAGGVGNLGYRLRLAGPLAVHVDLEENLWRGPTIVWAHQVFERAAFRHESGQPATGRLGELVGSIPVPEGAQSGDQLGVVATVQLPNGWAHPPGGPPTVRITLTADQSSGGWMAHPGSNVPLAASLTPASTVSPASPIARPEASVPTPTPWPRLAQPIGEEPAVHKASAVLPLALYTRARVHSTVQGDTWQVSFDDLHARLSDLAWGPETDPAPDRARPTAAIESVRVDVDRLTGQVLQAEAVADSHGVPEDPRPRLPETGAVPGLAASRVVVLLPPGASLRTVVPSSSSARFAGTTPFIRPVGPVELGALGVQVVRSAAGLRHEAEAGARVLWIHRAALGSVDPTWVQARLAEGRAIGVVDGGASDLVQALGIGQDGPGWLGSGSGRPVFALVQEYRCATSGGRTGGAQHSEWLSLAFWLAVSKGALADPCTQA